MDYQTLMNRRGIEDEIRQLERDIMKKENECAAATSLLSHLPRAPIGNSDKIARIATELAYLRRELEKCKRQREEVREYISSVPDSEIRSAMRKYFVQRKTWAVVASELNFEESGIRKKVERFLKRSKCPENPDST